MATKTSKAVAAPKTASKAMRAQFPDAADKETAEAMARMALRPSTSAAIVVEAYSKPLGAHDLGALADTLATGMEGLSSGDMTRAEAMLYGQAHALQAMFMNLARRASSQEYMANMETFMRMALKAQNQCRMTLETLAAIKNPPVVFARQANINNGGQQQVNNGTMPTSAEQARQHAHAATSQSEQNEVLGANDGERMDAGKASTAGRTDPHLEAVGEVDRPAKPRRQSASRQER